MKTSESIINIAAALSDAQAEMPAVAFDSVNPFLKNKYTSLGAIINASQPILAKHGLSIVQFPEDIGPCIGVVTRIIHTSGEWLEAAISLPLAEEKGKSHSQVAGSIITYLRRYSLQSVLRMYGDEDTDGTAAGEPKQVAVSVNVTRKTQPERPVAPAKAAAAAPAVADQQEGWKDYFLKEIKKCDLAIYAWDFAVSNGWIKINQTLSDVPKDKVPNTRAAADTLFTAIKNIKEQTDAAGGISQELDENYTAAHLEEETAASVSQRIDEVQKAAPAWKSVVLHFGPSKGAKLGDLDQKKMYGWAMNYKPEPYKGKLNPADAALRKALDEARDYYGFKEKGERAAPAPNPAKRDEPADNEDDVAF